jgi:hypothetical protein
VDQQTYAIKQLAKNLPHQLLHHAASIAVLCVILTVLGAGSGLLQRVLYNVEKCILRYCAACIKWQQYPKNKGFGFADGLHAEAACIGLV